MRLYLLIFIYIVTCVTVFSIKIQRNIHYINNKILNNIQKKNKTLKKHFNLNSHNDQTYLHKIQSNITNVGKNFSKRINFFKISVIIFTFSSLIAGLFYKKREKEKNENVDNSKNCEKEFFKYKCVKCNLVIFPAKGREKKFLKDNFICPNCGESNMDKYLTKK
ncbi:conserved Plasmodium protein, unknown function [Plasmodium gallinaceum]|uniref:Rubredoxin-like domain-containing protein n=1 Tax=Plasmodium gallinaceum TaxID=5849 RepID=A0A1J1GUF6_PLAGA|nr:conserved Plasmodium protein, unknown function [Plasmodium gallinaceum]CRG95875.1 conserved Plasmodium protein, unknown function [Plasmodium gallinaceum]